MQSANLVMYYERGLALIRRMQQKCIDGTFSFSHIYREYNADADGLANLALDRRTRAGPIVLDDNWRLHTQARLRHAIKD